MQDGITAAQRLAIQKLIRAKSDREIARLLRKSHRLLNLHCRRRSGGSHSERWTDYELRLVGRIRDEELAKLLLNSIALFPLRSGAIIDHLYRFEGNQSAAHYFVEDGKEGLDLFFAIHDFND
jgi:hypothetical protein